MKKFLRIKPGAAMFALAAATAIAPAMIAATPAAAQQTDRPSRTLTLSVGRGEQINLPSSITDVFVADPSVADVQVTNPRQIYLFGKAPGETTFYATNGAGKTVYSAIIRIGRNIETIDQMLTLAMPEANLRTNSLCRPVIVPGSPWPRFSPSGQSTIQEKLLTELIISRKLVRMSSIEKPV